MKEQEAVKTLINMALDCIGHGTDGFMKKSSGFYKLIKEYNKVVFGLAFKYSLVFYFQDEEKSIEVVIWEHFAEDRPSRRIAASEQIGVKENNSHLAFIKLFEDLHSKLRDRWRKQDF